MHINNSRTKSKTNISVRVNFSRDDLHHAHICIGDVVVAKDKILSFLEKDLNINTKGNPDVLVLDYETFLIDDARFLRERQQNNAVTGDKKFFLISFYAIMHEAQNALLKIFEEPTAGTHFFILTNTDKILLPTLLSRAEVSRFDDNRMPVDIVKTFLKSSQNERLLFVKDIIENKERGKAISLLYGISALLHEDMNNSKAVDALKNISKVLGYIQDRGASIKIIMEYVALATPRFVI